jgi:hypothetical protein
VKHQLLRAPRLGEVNRQDGGIGKEQAHEGIAEDGGDLANGLIERGDMIAHDQSPCPRSPKASCAVQKGPPTTISAWRSKRHLVDGIDAAYCRVR